MNDPIRILIVENVKDDVDQVADALEEGGLNASLERVESEGALRSALRRGSWDVILLNDGIRGFSGSHALGICREVGSEAPIIIVSGSVGEDAAVRMIKEGADDYVLKSNLKPLAAAVQRAMIEARIRDERRQSEEGLRENREWLYATLRSVGEAVIATDVSGRIRFMNRVAEELTGFEESIVIGRALDDVVRLEQPPEQTEESQSTPAGSAKGAWQEFVLVRRCGQRIPVLKTDAPIASDGRSIMGSVISLRDIEERKRAEEQIRQTNQELEQFVRSVSHDLQEPLRMICLYSELLKSRFPNGDDDTQECLRFVAGSAERMSRLLTDLRAYADITRSLSAEPEESDAEVALQQALANLAALIEETGAIIVHDPLPALPVHGAHMIQLFQNLISNSIKYRRDGHAPTIRIESLREGDEWRFSFADNGAGIRAEYTNRVFDFFQRFHSADVPGTGMGLAICQRIVHRYGGRIWVESTPGQGSIFRLTLPSFKTFEKPRAEHVADAS